MNRRTAAEGCRSVIGQREVLNLGAGHRVDAQRGFLPVRVPRRYLDVLLRGRFGRRPSPFSSQALLVLLGTFTTGVFLWLLGRVHRLGLDRDHQFARRDVPDLVGTVGIEQSAVAPLLGRVKDDRTGGQRVALVGNGTTYLCRRLRVRRAAGEETQAQRQAQNG